MDRTLCQFGPRHVVSLVRHGLSVCSDIGCQFDRNTQVSLERIKLALAEFRRMFRKTSQDKRKKLVHALIKRITVTKDRKIDRIEWNIAL